MTNTFNRNDGTFAQVAFSDLSGSATTAQIPTVSSFSAHKAASDQTGVVSGTNTQVTFGTELYDVGSNFASSVWTPPAGKVAMVANLIMDGTIASGNACVIAITKNSTTGIFRRSVGTTITNAAWASIAIEDVANGTDAYGVLVNVPSTGTSTVRGAVSYTYFMGHWISP